MKNMQNELNDDDKKNNNAKTSTALVSIHEQPPTVLPTVLLEELIPLPGPVLPIHLDSQERREALLQAKNGNGFILLLNHRHEPRYKNSKISKVMEHAVQEVIDQHAKINIHDEDELVDVGSDEADSIVKIHQLQQLCPVGVLGRLIRVVRLSEDRLTALVHFLCRAQVVELCQDEPFLKVGVLYPLDVVADEEAFQAMYRQMRVYLQAFLQAHPTLPEELKLAANQISHPAFLADFVAQHMSRDDEERMAFLNELDVVGRMRKALEIMVRELDLLTVGNRITQEIRQKTEKHQREYWLREQLRAIRSELGEEKDPSALAVAELQKKLEDAGLSEAADKRAKEELKRLQLLPTESPEHNVIRSYLEWIASLPWSKYAQEQQDLLLAKKILDEDHYGLSEVKERIIEYLAVHQLNAKRMGSLLCFAGPPGVGKTSLGQSIARALGRPFYRFSVGGMRDEAEIKGHRRTYIGAMPGRILQGLRSVQAANPVFMIDELDKIGSDWRGDPSSALLEVLDPSQNKTFVDHYLDIPFDLSKVMFIATVNVQAELPSALADRLEIIDLPGYIPEEKLEIAWRYLLPRQLLSHGLRKKDLKISRSIIKDIIHDYSYEAGVRELDRQISKLCRRRAVKVVEKSSQFSTIQKSDVLSILGPAKIRNNIVSKQPPVGVAVGLAWTPVGGDVLMIEVAAMPGKDQLNITGHLGNVMKESAEVSVAYVKSMAQEFGIDHRFFKNFDLHMHFPAGAVPKDGPSAGVTITTALISLLQRRRIPARLAMTGEMRLTGEVLPVGGIREKVVAARTRGFTTLIVPKGNQADVLLIPEIVRKRIHFIYAETYADILKAVFKRSKPTD